MKKHILLTAVLFAFAIGLKAQITLDSSDYAYAGKVLKMAIVKNSSVISIGGAAMQTWDFRDCGPIHLGYVLFTTPIRCLGAMFFPDPT